MEWKDIGSMIGKAAPMLGTLLAPATGGASLAIGALISSALGVENTPDAIAAELKNNPDALLKLKELEFKENDSLRSQVLELAKLDAQKVASVNDTMQVEAKSEHWQTYSWRPFIGFQFGFYIMSLWVLPFFGKVPTILSPDAVMAVGAILGVASWYRGKMQAENINKMGSK